MNVIILTILILLSKTINAKSKLCIKLPTRLDLQKYTNNFRNPGLLTKISIPTYLERMNFTSLYLNYVKNKKACHHTLVTYSYRKHQVKLSKNKKS